MANDSERLIAVHCSRCGKIRAWPLPATDVERSAIKVAADAVFNAHLREVNCGGWEHELREEAVVHGRREHP